MPPKKLPARPATRFVKGRSRNPRGRPRGALGIKTILKRINNEGIVVTVNDREERVTVGEAMIMCIVDLCTKGDAGMINQLLDANLIEKVPPLIIELLPEDEEDESEAETQAE